MILIIGGAGSGKGAYARALGYTDADIAYNVHETVFEQPEAAFELLEALLTKPVVTCDEVGSGVIPLDKHDRLGREATGRLCVLLAQHAERVIRMVAGIPVVIKDKA